MIGSETFIIVAFMCNENSTPRASASATCSARKAVRARLDMNVASTISPSSTGTASASTVTVPAPSTCSMRNVVSAAIVVDTSLWRKSPPDIVETWVRESGDHSPIGWGYFRANCLTARGARRSELPSRRTGLTALPFTLS